MAHIIEVAKSGRAGCRTCRKPIAKGELRFGEETINTFADAGETTFRWHHMTCAATKLPDELTGAMAAYPGEIENRAELDALMATAVASKPPPFPYADRAPTSRAKCLECGQTVEKGSLRVVIERDIERGMSTQKGAGSLHPACAAAHVESKGGTHEELTIGLQANTRALSDADRDELFSIV
jgi:hypothetical protein